MSESVWAVVNPTARGAAALPDALTVACRAAGLGEPVLRPTTVDRTGYEQAREAVAAGARLVVVGGGDGTVREVARALAGSGVELGIVPLGTANLFAHNLGLRTRRVHAAVRTALSGRPHPVDVGWASWRTVAHGRTGRPVPEQPFLVMAGLGHDAATVLDTDRSAKGRLGWLAYLARGVRHLRARPVGVRLSLDGRPARHLDTWTVLVANCAAIPGGVEVFPSVRPDDGTLEALIVPVRRLGQWASVAAAGLSRHRVPSRVLHYARTRRVWAIPDAPQPLHLDGDVVGVVADLRVRVQPGALTVRGAQP